MFSRIGRRLRVLAALPFLAGLSSAALSSAALSSAALSSAALSSAALSSAALLLSLSLGCRDSAAAHVAELPRLGTVGPFWLTDQAGRSFSEQSLNGQVWVAAFMFTRCPTICPELTRRMRYLQEQARSRQVPLHLVSFSVDPENDTPEVLRNYAAQYGADTASWSFLTGDDSVIRKAAEEGFKIGVDGTPKAGAEHYGITHGTHLVLLDGTRTIRGYYQSSEPTKLAQLLDDAAALAR